MGVGAVVSGVEDTDQFISAHLDSVRNEIIKMSLFIEIGGLTMGMGAVVSGIFGMNLTNAMEKNPYAFSLVCLGLMAIMLALFAGFTTKYLQLKADTSSAQSFTLLKNFFSYVDDLEYNVFNKDVEKSEFKETVEKITGLKISDKESEYLFKMVDVDKNGVIGAERRMSFLPGQKDFSNHLLMLNGSRMSLFAEQKDKQGSNKFGSKLSVFSGRRESSDNRNDAQESSDNRNTVDQEILEKQ